MHESKNMQEDMRAVKAENKELRDRFEEAQRQVQLYDPPQDPPQASTRRDDSDDLGIVGLVKITGAKNIFKKCSVM